MNEQIFGWWGDSPIPPVGKTLYKLCQQVFIYNEKAPCTSHTSCAKVTILFLEDLGILCVTDINGIYCVFSVCNTINLSYHEHVIMPNYGRSISQYLSLNIKHTCSWRNKFGVNIYIYIICQTYLFKTYLYLYIYNMTYT